MRASRFLGGLTLALLLSGGSLQAAPIVTDGGFETPNVPTPDVSSDPYWDYYYTGETFGAWKVDVTTTAVDQIHTNYTGNYVTWPDAIEGSQYVYLSDAVGYSVISQIVQLEAGHLYDLSFWLSDFVSMDYGSGAWVSADLVNTLSSESIFDEMQVFSHGHAPDWKSYSVGFSVATTGDYKLSFASQQGWAANIDGVAITDVTPQTPGVPDTGATLGLLGGALALLAAGIPQRRRR